MMNHVERVQHKVIGKLGDTGFPKNAQAKISLAHNPYTGSFGQAASISALSLRKRKLDIQLMNVEPSLFHHSPQGVERAHKKRTGKVWSIPFPIKHEPPLRKATEDTIMAPLLITTGLPEGNLSIFPKTLTLPRCRYKLVSSSHS